MNQRPVVFRTQLTNFDSEIEIYSLVYKVIRDWTAVIDVWTKTFDGRRLTSLKIEGSPDRDVETKEFDFVKACVFSGLGIQ